MKTEQITVRDLKRDDVIVSADRMRAAVVEGWTKMYSQPDGFLANLVCRIRLQDTGELLTLRDRELDMVANRVVQ